MIDAEAGGILPVARFENGDWIGRVIDRSGVDIALMHTDLTDWLPNTDESISPDGLTWRIERTPDFSMWVYMRNAEPMSWVLLMSLDLDPRTVRESALQSAMSESSRLVAWEIKPPGDQRFFGVEDTPIRDAWIWLLLDIFDIEMEPESWTKLQLPTVVPNDSWYTIEAADQDPEIEEDLEVIYNRMAIAIESLTEEFFYMDRIEAEAESHTISLGRGTRFRWSGGPGLVNPWTVSFAEGHWTVYLRQPRYQHRTLPHKAIVSSPHMETALVMAGVIAEEDEIDTWLDTHARAGELVHDPEPYLLLDAPSPLLRPLADFSAWYRSLLLEVS